MPYDDNEEPAFSLYCHEGKHQLCHNPKCDCMCHDQSVSEPDGMYAEYLHRAEIGRRMLEIPGYGHD